MIKSKFLFVVVACYLFGSIPIAYAAPTIIFDGTKADGIMGLDVNGYTYDVDFIRDSYESIW